MAELMLSLEPTSFCHAWLDPKGIAQKRQMCPPERMNQEYWPSEIQALCSKRNGLSIAHTGLLRKISKQENIKTALVKSQADPAGMSFLLL